MECDVLREQFDQGQGSASAIPSGISIEDLDALLQKHNIDTSKYLSRKFLQEFACRTCVCYF